MLMILFIKNSCNESISYYFLLNYILLKSSKKYNNLFYTF